MNASVSKAGPLPSVPLGDTGMLISRVGFGSWAVGGGDWAMGWGDQDDAKSIAAIRHALACGVNWIDTAAIYGLGRSEQVVAKALRGIPKSERPYVFTKCGLIGDPNQPRALPAKVGAPASIRREVEASLRRLETERIDLYQMHWPATDGTALEAYWQTLLDLKREGKIRAAGLSNHSLAQLEAAERLGHVDTLQPPFSAIRREVAEHELPWCVTHHTGVIVYSPMQSGLLSGGFSKARVDQLPSNDWRSRDVEFKQYLERNLKLAAAFGAIGKRHGISTPAVAIAWALAWPGVTAAIVGARSPEQVDGWLEAARFVLSEDELQGLAGVLRDSGAGAGPVLPTGLPPP